MSRPRRSALRVLASALALSTLAGTSCARTQDDEGLLIAAASDVRPAFEELASRFEALAGASITFTFGSSGQLREQVLNGAPFDVFVSANGSYVDEVIDAGLADGSSRSVYAIGRLVIVAAPGVELPDTLDELADRVRTDDWRLAIANPEHAPYGTAAEQALTTAGVIDEVRPRLVLGESVADALRIVRSGNAEVGLVARSLAIDAGMGHVDIDASLHEPIEQTLVVLAMADPTSLAFVELLTSDEGRAVLRRSGFEIPVGG